MAKAVFANVVSYIEDLPPTSPNRKILLKAFGNGIDHASSSHYFNISERTIRKAATIENDIIKEMKSIPGTKRKRIAESTEEIISDFFDNEIKVCSGRSFRIQTITNQELYERYKTHCQKIDSPPVSKTTFETKFLFKEKIHHNTDDTYCKYCLQLEGKNIEEGEEIDLEELQNHERTCKTQSAFYKVEKK